MILGDAVAQVTHVYAQPQYIQWLDKQGLDEIFFDLLVPSLSETHRKGLPGKVAQQTPKPRALEHTGRRGGNKAQFVVQPLPVSLFVASTTALQFVCFSPPSPPTPKPKSLSSAWINLLLVSFLPAQKPEDIY